tara:strand:- start:965 stop:1354 length:390 start_codon:yes stop_codon:yes gene_type:complete
MHFSIRKALILGRGKISWSTKIVYQREEKYLTRNNKETTKGNKKLVIYPNRVSILYSYGVPVAGEDEFGFFKTDKSWSNTTSRHINSYVNYRTARVVSQDVLNRYMRLANNSWKNGVPTFLEEGGSVLT